MYFNYEGCLLQNSLFQILWEKTLLFYAGFKLIAHIFFFL